MSESAFWELKNKKDRVQRRVDMLSDIQFGSSVFGVLCWIIGLFLYHRQPFWFSYCLVFTVTYFVLGCAVGHYRKAVLKIAMEMKPLIGGAGTGRA